MPFLYMLMKIDHAKWIKSWTLKISEVQILQISLSEHKIIRMGINNGIIKPKLPSYLEIKIVK